MIVLPVVFMLSDSKRAPPSRMKVASRFHDSVWYIEWLPGQRGTPTRTLLWQVVHHLEIKNCALEQVPSDTKALVYR